MMHGLVDENKFTWLLKCLSHLGNKKYPYQVYPKPEENNGIFNLVTSDAKETTIALLSDWASDTPESVRVASLVGPVGYSIHMGDTYYVGNSKEIADSFNDSFGAPWPYGTFGSFAMLGNHEMYSSGKSYFNELLPYMGIYRGQDTVQRQEASYFCLENDHWRIIGLDTGYNSLTGWIGWLPNRSMQLRAEQLAWLKDVVKLDGDHRGIVLLSHHPPVSAFHPYEYRALLPQLDSLFSANRTVLWFCGHEHALAIYGKNDFGDKLSGFPRCIGYGGMPVEIGHLVPKSSDVNDFAIRRLVIYDRRKRNVINGNILLGHNGFVQLRLQSENLRIDYYDDSAETVKNLLVTEHWVVDKQTGNLTGKTISDLTSANPSNRSEERLTHFQADINKAIGRREWPAQR